MYVLQVTAPETETPVSEAFDRLVETIGWDYVESDDSNMLDPLFGVYVWSEDKEKLEKAYLDTDLDGFCVVIDDVEEYDLQKPEWSEVKVL